jgi:ribosomal protein S8
MPQMKIDLLAGYLTRPFLYLYEMAGTRRRKSLQVANIFALDDLAPVVSKEQNKVYSDALKWALSNDNICNIAVTGPYGSGKSSFIRTFREEYPKKYKYLNISLASFKEDGPVMPPPPPPKKPTGSNIVPQGNDGTVNADTVTNEQAKKNEAQQLIELSILQQMFYKAHEKDIPDSRFKRINQLTRLTIGLRIGLIMSFLLGITALFFPESLFRLSYYRDYFSIHPNREMLLALLLIIPGLVVFLAILLRFFNHSGFKKLSISSGEIEINPKSETSILNKYFDEIIYFFQATRYNLVVIEDLDRFNDPEIFTNLRELNGLLNQSGQLKGLKIVFLYAVRDEIFSDDKVRTKFFDFIIPIVPVISWSNSLVKLSEKLRAPELNLEISDQFIAGVTQYIDDMRALKNIFNEFMLYQATLQVPASRHQKLLAIIIYKNIFPKDFAALHEQQGIIHDVFQAKETIRKKMISLKDKEIESVKTRQLDASNMLSNNLNELRSIYILEFQKSIGRAQHYKVGSDTYDSWELIDEDAFERIRTGVTIGAYFNGSTYHRNYDFKSISAAVDPLKTYLERKKILEDKTHTRASGFKLLLKKLREEREAISTARLSYILKEVPTMNERIEEIVGTKKLLAYLVREGYIDESHTELISHFYPGEISRTDMVFLGHVNDRVNLDLGHPLEKTRKLISLISLQDFSTPAILNLDLVDYLLDYPMAYEKQLALVIALLQQYSDRSPNFIDLYLPNGRNNIPFMDHLFRNWSNGWATLTEDRSAEEIRDYLKIMILYLDAEALTNLDQQRQLSLYVRSLSDFLLILPEENDQKVKSFIDTLEIRFHTLEINGRHDLFRHVVDNRRFILSSDMCLLVLNFVMEGVSERLLPTLTNIRATNDEKLTSYILDNLEEFAMNVLLENKTVGESQDSYHIILNGISHGAAETYISEVDFKIEDIRKIESHNVWEYLLIYDRLLPSWNNMVSCYLDQEGEIGSHQIDYLNLPQNAQSLGRAILSGRGWTAGKVADFTEKLLDNNLISDESYAELIKAYAFGDKKDRDVSQLSEKKVSLLIDYGKLDLSVHNLDQLRSHFPDQVNRLLLRYKKQFLAKQSAYQLTAQERLTLLAGTVLNESQKSRVIRAIKTEEELNLPALSNQIIKIINKGDFGKIERIMIKGLTKFASETSSKAALISLYVTAMDKELFIELLSNTGGDYLKVVNRKKPAFDKNPVNLKLIAHFEKHGLITSKRIDEEKQKIFVFTSTKKK